MTPEENDSRVNCVAQRQTNVAMYICFSSNLVLADLDGCSYVILTVETHIVDGVLFLHPIVHNNDLKENANIFKLLFK